MLYIGHRFADDRCLWSEHPCRGALFPTLHNELIDLCEAQVRHPYALMPYGEREISFIGISPGADYLTLGEGPSLQLHTATLLGGVCFAVRLRGVKCRPCRHLLHQLAVVATEP